MHPSHSGSENKRYFESIGKPSEATKRKKRKIGESSEDESEYYSVFMIMDL